MVYFEIPRAFPQVDIRFSQRSSLPGLGPPFVPEAPAFHLVDEPALGD